MHGFLPLKNYKIVVNVQKEELICMLRHRVLSRDLVRYNCLCYTNPGRLVGVISEDRVHVTSNAHGLNTFQLILHGHIKSIGNKQCEVSYCFTPNNYSILWNIVLALVFIVLKHPPIWQSFAVVGSILAIETILSIISAVQTSTLFYELVEDAHKNS